MKKAKREKGKKKESRESILAKLEARLAPFEEEPYGENRGHEKTIEFLKSLDMPSTANHEGYLRTMLYTRHALRIGERNLKGVFGKKMAISLIGEPTNQKIRRQHGKQIIMELWYHGKSSLLEEYRKAHDLWKENQGKKVKEAKELLSSDASETQKVDPSVPANNEAPMNPCDRDDDRNDAKDNSLDKEETKQTTSTPIIVLV